jgi:predicted permease
VTRATEFYDEVLERVRVLPQVSAAGLTRFLPLSDGPWTFSFEIEGRPSPPQGERRSYGYHPITTDFFRAAGMRLLRGRDITDADNADAAPVLIINEAMKQQCWPDTDPIGTHIRFEENTGDPRWREIVGIVNDVRHDGPHLDPRPAVYGPQYQAFAYMLDRMRLVVRTSSDPLSIAQAVRQIVYQIDPNLAVSDIRTMHQLLASSVARPRFSMTLLVSFASAAVLLALIGIYGVVSYGVRQQLPELGLRVALGAQRSIISRIVLAQGLILAGLGVTIGVPAALAGTRLLRSLLFGISAADPLTYLVSAALLAIAAVAACYLPARRAASADPMVVMRGE